MIETAESLLCRGMRDLLPDEMVRFRRIEQTFRKACQSWGYSEIRTPTLEHLYLFTSFGTLSPHLLGRVYSFLDWDGWTGERVVLRPDATIPVARLFREQLRSSPAKLAYVTNIFRFAQGDEPREVWQCGAELIGESWPYGDLEQIAMALHIVRSAGVRNATISLSHSGVVRALLERAGFASDEQAELYDRLLDGDRNVVADVEARLPDLGPGLRLLSDVGEGDSAFLANLRSAFLPGVPEMAVPLDELDLIALTATAFGASVTVSVTEVRDFEYYTGPVFRLVSGDATLASGGRYDRLITDANGGPLAACGFALHVDALLPLVQPPAESSHGIIQVTPADMSPKTLSTALVVAEQLQNAGFRAALVDTEPACRWCLTVDARAGQPHFRFDDRERHNRVEAHSIDQVIAAMRRS